MALSRVDNKFITSLESSKLFGEFPASPQVDGSGLTGIEGVDLNSRYNLALNYFGDSIRNNKDRLSLDQGWVDTFEDASDVVDEGRSIPKIQMDGQGNYALISTCSNAGMVNGPEYLFSCIVNFSGNADGTLVTLVQSSNARWLIERSTDNKLTVSLTDTGTFSFGNLGRIKSTSNFVAADGDIYLQVAVNTATQTMQIVKNGVLETNVVTHTLNAGTIMLDNGNYTIGDSAPVNGCMAQWYHALSFLDLSVQSNREKFVTGTGASARAVDLGADGSLPTGSQPAVYLNNPYATWNVNLGSGNNFTADQMVFVDGGYLDLSGTTALYSSESFTNSYGLHQYSSKDLRGTHQNMSNTQNQRQGFVFNSGTGTSVQKISWFFNDNTASGGNASLTTYISPLASGSIAGGNAVPSDNILAISDSKALPTGSGGWDASGLLTFTFSNPIPLTANTEYAIYVGYEGTNTIGIAWDIGTSVDATECQIGRNNGTWSFNGGATPIHYLYTSKNLDLITKGSDDIGNSPATAPETGHMEILMTEQPASGTSIWSDTLTAESGGFGGTSYRQIVSGSNISTSGNKIRVRVEAPVAGTEGTGFDNIAIVERSGTSANGTTIPTEILFGGVSGIVATVGSQMWSDWTDFEIDQTKDYLLIADITGSNSLDTARINASGGDGVYAMSSAPGNSYNTAGFTVTANHPGRTFLFNNLEVGVPQVPNVDYIAKMSRNGGTDYSNVTLTRTKTQVMGTDYNMLVGEADFTDGDATGTNIVGKIYTANKDKITVTGVSVNWK